MRSEKSLKEEEEPFDVPAVNPSFRRGGGTASLSVRGCAESLRHGWLDGHWLIVLAIVFNLSVEAGSGFAEHVAESG